MIDFSNMSARERRDLVRTVRDCLAGEGRIKAQGQRYLPKSEGMRLQAYSAMKDRASFLNTPRTVLDGVVGRIFRKPPTFELGGLESRLPWWSAGYRSWAMLSRSVMRETLSVGRIAILVEPSPRPFECHLVVFFDEDILATAKDEDGRLSRVEIASADGKTLRLSIESGVYKVQTDDGEPVVASLSGKTLDVIPIVFITPNGPSPDPEYPPLADLALKAITHYQLWAEYRQALHYVASPQPFVAGFARDEVPETVGPTTIWKTANPSAKAQFVSFEGRGLEELRIACENVKGEMVAQGASMLSTRNASNVASRTVELRQREDTSLVVSAIHSVNEGLAAVARLMLEWERQSGDPVVRINTDLVDTTLDAGLLKTLRDCYLSGAISWETFVDVLRRGEIIPAERTAADELALIENDPRTLGARLDHEHHALP
jgi:hypothetical protein